jgi:hypothetical protein
MYMDRAGLRVPLAVADQISGMQTVAADSFVAIKEIRITINRISEIPASVAAAVEQQGAMTSKIASSVQRAALNTIQVSTDVTDVNREAVETGLASARVS